MAAPPSFDLVVATVDRVEPLGRLLDSLARQTHTALRVLVVDQNEDDRLAPVLRAHDGLRIERIRSRRGLSAARNAALGRLEADVVAFPDDDCAYPDDLLERVAAELARRPEVDGVSGRTADDAGTSLGRWPREAGAVDARNVWHRVNSAALFLRRDVVLATGAFDERLGLGGERPWTSGEEVDYLVRALRGGAAVRYDPSLVVRHAQRRLDAPSLARVGRRDGASVGYVLRKHRYPAGAVARMLVRPVGGALLAAARGDLARVRFHAATLRGRLEGYVRSAS